MRHYDPYETTIEGVKFRAPVLAMMLQTDLIFDTRDMFGIGLEKAFSIEIGDVFRKQFDASYVKLPEKEQINIAADAVFTKLPRSIFLFLNELDRELVKSVMSKYIPMCLVERDGQWVSVNIDIDLDVQKLVHFKLLSWYLAVQLGPFIVYSLPVFLFLQKLLEEEDLKDTSATEET